MAQNNRGNDKRRGRTQVVLLTAALVIVLFYAAGALLARKAILGGLSMAFPSAGCSFKAYRVNPFGYISLKGVLLNVPGKYIFSADEARVEYGFTSLFSGRLRRVYLDNPVLLLQGPSADNGREAVTAGSGFKLPRFMPERLDIYGAEIKRAGDAASFELKGSLHAGFSGSALSELFISADTLRFGQFSAGGIYVYFPGEGKEGRVTLEKFSFKDILLKDVKGTLWMNKDGKAQVLFSPVNLWGGYLEAAADIYGEGSGIKYKCRFRLRDTNLEIVSRELGFSEKVSLSGITAGEATLDGGSAGLGEVSASFGTSSSGGVMNIRDKRILDYLAVQSGRPLQTIYDSLRDYHYRSAVLNVTTAAEELRIYAVFEGGQGKRMFDVRLHGAINNKALNR